MLREARWQVKVAVVDSREAFARGELKGVWQLGAVQGGALGVLVWFESDEHVAVLKGPGMHSLLDSIPLCTELVEAPWCCGCAGAPKMMMMMMTPAFKRVPQGSKNIIGRIGEEREKTRQDKRQEQEERSPRSETCSDCLLYTSPSPRDRG